jgi:hypothetical protein
MDPEFVRQHIELVQSRSPDGENAPLEVAERLAVECWPGGCADRSEPAALKWLRRWRPTSSAVSPPACSCATGRCRICN